LDFVLFSENETEIIRRCIYGGFVILELCASLPRKDSSFRKPGCGSPRGRCNLLQQRGWTAAAFL